jgi:hypothetical protein
MYEVSVGAQTFELTRATEQLKCPSRCTKHYRFGSSPKITVARVILQRIRQGVRNNVSEIVGDTVYSRNKIANG